MSENILAALVKIQTEEKRSRFIGIGTPCHSVGEFGALLTSLHKEYADASHITYAYKIRENGELRIKCYDAGEPAQTAGRPILGHIDGNNLINSVIVVIRYFGGVKLGAGGLVRAYSACAGSVIGHSKIVPYEIMEEMLIVMPYESVHHMEHTLARLGITIGDKAFAAQVSFRISVASTRKDELLSACAQVGSVQISPLTS